MWYLVLFVCLFFQAVLFYSLQYMDLVMLLGKVDMGLITALVQSAGIPEPCSVYGLCFGFLLAIISCGSLLLRGAQSHNSKAVSQTLLLLVALSLGAACFQELSRGISAHFAAASFLPTSAPLCPTGKGDRQSSIKPSGGSEASFPL